MEYKKPVFSVCELENVIITAKLQKLPNYTLQFHSLQFSPAHSSRPHIHKHTPEKNTHSHFRFQNVSKYSLIVIHVLTISSEGRHLFCVTPFKDTRRKLMSN
jgi:hypothetical protein